MKYKKAKKMIEKSSFHKKTKACMLDFLEKVSLRNLEEAKQVFGKQVFGKD